MPQRIGYFDKFLAEKFQHIDESINHIDQKVERIDQKVEKIVEDNKATRRWIFGTVVGTGLTVLVGLAALLLSFASIQNSWMQQVFSFVGKMIVK